MPNRQAGFTFVELYLVIVLLGVVAVIMVPKILGSIDHSKLKAAAVEVESAFSYAQNFSVNSGQSSRVTVHRTQDTLVVEAYRPAVDLLGAQATLIGAEVNAGAFQTMEHPVQIGEVYKVDFTVNRIDVTQSDFNGGYSVIFDRYGNPDHSGTVKLAQGNFLATITLDANTGLITTEGV